MCSYIDVTSINQQQSFIESDIRQPRILVQLIPLVGTPETAVDGMNVRNPNAVVDSEIPDITTINLTEHLGETLINESFHNITMDDISGQTSPTSSITSDKEDSLLLTDTQHNTKNF